MSSYDDTNLFCLVLQTCRDAHVPIALFSFTSAPSHKQLSLAVGSWIKEHIVDFHHSIGNILREQFETFKRAHAVHESKSFGAERMRGFDRLSFDHVLLTNGLYDKVARHIQYEVDTHHAASINSSESVYQLFLSFTAQEAFSFFMSDMCTKNVFHRAEILNLSALPRTHV